MHQMQKADIRSSLGYESFDPGNAYTQHEGEGVVVTFIKVILSLFKPSIIYGFRLVILNWMIELDIPPF